MPDEVSALEFGATDRHSGATGEFPMTSLKTEIAQTTPFYSAEEEAVLNLMRTSDCVQRAFQQSIRTSRCEKNLTHIYLPQTR